MGQRNSSTSEEGSERERCFPVNERNVSKLQTTKTAGKYYVAPLIDDSCPFLSVPPNILEKVCGFLDLPDISSLSQSCKYMDNFVGELLRHQCCSPLVTSAHRDFVRKFSDLSSLRERRVLADILRSEPEEEVSRVSRYRMLANCRMLASVERRVSTCQPAVCVPHRGSGYISTPPDPELGRNVLYVNSVCWLQVSHTFKAVEPGNYSLSLLMKIAEDWRMPLRSSDYTEWTVTYPGEAVETEQIQVKVFKSWWQNLSDGEVPQSGSEHLKVRWEGDSSWFHVIVPEVTVRRNGDVSLDMRDVVCPYWKSGLYFDYLQLIKT